MKGGACFQGLRQLMASKRWDSLSVITHPSIYCLSVTTHLKYYTTSSMLWHRVTMFMMRMQHFCPV